MASERAGLRYRVHADVRQAQVKREREHVADLDRSHNRGEIDSRGVRIDVSPAFADWAGDVSAALRGRKAIWEYADRGFTDRLRRVGELVHGSAGNAEIMGECLRRDGAADLVAAAFLALELLDDHAGEIDALRDCARNLSRAWDRVLDGRIVDLVDVPDPEIASLPDHVDLLGSDAYWDCVLTSADAEDAPGTDQEWELESWEIADIAAETLTAGHSTSAQSAPTGRLPELSTSAPVVWPLTWTATRKIAGNVSAFAHLQPASNRDSTDSADPILPRQLPPVTYYAGPSLPPYRRPAETLADRSGRINRGGSSISGYVRNARAYAAVGVQDDPAPRRSFAARLRAWWLETCERQQRIERRLLAGESTIDVVRTER